MRYKGLDLNLLHALDVLLELRNVSRAAEQLNLSQSAMSAALARLREFFDDELLVPEGRKMHPTAYAVQIATQVRTCLNMTDELLSVSRSFDPTLASRTFRIISSDYIIASLLVGLAQRLANDAPGIRLDIVLPDMSAEERLDRGEIDLMISPPEYLLPDHPKVELFTEAHVVVGWRDNPLFRKRMTEEQFWACGHVGVSVGSHRVATFADRYLQTMKQDRRVECIVPSFTLVPPLIVGTPRLALLQKRLAVLMSKYHPITHVPAPFPIPLMREMAQFHRTRSTDLGLRWLVSQLQQAANEKATRPKRRRASHEK